MTSDPADDLPHRLQRTSAPSRRGSAVALAAGLIVLGLLARLPHLAAPPLEFHPTRQYRSALIARSLYRAHQTTLPQGQRDVARAAAARPVLEPRVMEHLAAALYRATGGEHLWLPRLASVVFWIVGSLCAFAVARRLFSVTAAAVALAVCLFLPYSLQASQSFQPDPLMVALLAAGLWVCVRYHERPTFVRLLFLALITAAGTFVKPMALFFLIPPVLALSIEQNGLRGCLRDWHLAVWLALTLVPAATYYAVAAYATGDLGRQAEGSFIPGLLITIAFWHGWLAMVGRVVGYGGLLAGLAGVLLTRDRPACAMLRGLWIGYVVFGLVFPYHIHTHDYYSLPLVLVVALSLASLTQTFVSRLGARVSAVPWRRGVVGALVVGAGLGVWKGQPLQPDRVYFAVAGKYERLGAQLAHSTRLIVLDGAYGFPLYYHGELAGANWPLSIDFNLRRLEGRREPSAAERLAGFDGAEYFVATSLPELSAQPELVKLLATRYPTLRSASAPTRGEPPVVFDLRKSTLEPERWELHFGALGDGTAMTGSQPLQLLGASTTSWTARSSSPVFTVSPASGTGRGLLVVSIVLAKAPPDERDVQAVITITRGDGVDMPPLRAHLHVLDPGDSAAPIGSLDLPPEATLTATGPVFFAGWALDDIEVTGVRLYREASGERAAQPVLVAEIPQVERARPDVEQVYPGLPLNWRAGWGYHVRPESLPTGQPATSTFHVYVEDAEGHTTRLGSRTITWRTRSP